MGEIHEQSWCPGPIRDGATDCLNAVATFVRQYDGTVPLLVTALTRSRARRIVDLGSGGGGPWWRLAPKLSNVVHEIVLTDLHPSERAPVLARQSDIVTAWPSPVDALHVPSELTGFRTLFTAFHHFAPDQACALLQNAVANRQGIGLFEQTRRAWWALLVMLALPWIALLVVPFVRPWRLSRLFWTYVIPAIPVVFMVDGIISCLRSYTEEEIIQMIEGLETGSEMAEVTYVWEVGRVPSPLSPIGVIYAVLYPVSEERPAHHP